MHKFLNGKNNARETLRGRKWLHWIIEQTAIRYKSRKRKNPDR